MLRDTHQGQDGPWANAVACLRGWFGKFVAMCKGGQAPRDLAERLHLAHAKDFSYIISAISLLGLCTIALLFLDFRSVQGAMFHDALMCTICLCYFTLIERSRAWLRRAYPSEEEAKAFIAGMARLLMLLGSLWSVLLFALMRHVDISQLCLLCGVMVGCLATPVVLSPLSCAFAYWTPVSIGIFITLLSIVSVDGFAILNLLAFIGLTGCGIIYLNRRLNERAIGAIRLEETSEVIKLLLRDFEESASDWLWETNAQLELQQVSQRLAQVAQRPAAAIRGVFPGALLGDITRYEHRDAAQIGRLLRAIEERSPFRDLVVPVIVNNEQRYWLLTGKPILDKLGRFAGYHGVGSDITGPRRQQEQIAFLARHDSLTKLPNRVLFNEVLHKACDHCATTSIALLCLDLDHFKIINDTLGHASGDGVLVAVAERLRGCLRECDTAARLGGDEFAIILVTEFAHEAGAIAARIIERVMRPYQIEGQRVQLGISIGITMAPADSREPSRLLKNADLALYRAKSDGRGVWRLYDPEMDARAQGRRALQSALQRAVLCDEFRLEFQPIINLADGRIVGAEALLRWQHPERGLLLPSEFIALAEETGLIGQIGEWALQQACKVAAVWPARISLAVNLSPLQFRDPGLVHIINRALSRCGLHPSRLELEITETTVLETNSQTVDALWKLHDSGVRIALDDFGTGYSSLSYLRRFPFDKIKIDRSFIHDLGFEQDDSSIILAIIGLAERMNMIVTAEGVETSAQASRLRAFGCGQAQGFLFHASLSAEKFAEVIALDAPAGDGLDAPAGDGLDAPAEDRLAAPARLGHASATP